MSANSPEHSSSSLHPHRPEAARGEPRTGGPILSINDLACRLGVTKVELRLLTAHIDGRNGKYRSFGVSRSARGNVVRQVRDPAPELKVIQRRINKKILVPLVESQIAHGGIRGKSPRTNACVHLGRSIVATLDVKKFFESLRPTKVHEYFRNRLSYGREVAAILTRLVTLEGGIPLGAPTSMSMANLLMEDVDATAAREATGRGLAVTRFVDDFAFSGDHAGVVINIIGKALSRQGLKMHRPRRDRNSKLKIMPARLPQRVTGLNVNHPSGPTVPRGTRDAIRAAIFAVSKTHDPHERAAAARSIAGQIAYVRAFHPGNADRLAAQLNHVLEPHAA